MDLASKKSVEDEDFEDETVTERLIGLTEMFPEWLRHGVSVLTSYTIYGTKSALHYSKAGLWVAASSATIMLLPVMFESERSQMEEQQLQQQRQILLGPNAAVSGSHMPGMPGVGHGMMPIPLPPQQA